MGLATGMPDYLVFSPARHAPRGVALELKRVGGRCATPQQLRWLADLAALGWQTRVCYGALDAIDWLEGLGY